MDYLLPRNIEKLQMMVCSWMQKVNALLDINYVYTVGEIHRAQQIISSQDAYNNEHKRLKQILQNNGYTNIHFDYE